MPVVKRKKPGAPGPFLMIPLEFYLKGGPLHPGTDCAMTPEECILFQIVCSRGPNKCEDGFQNWGRVKGERIATLASIREVTGWTERTILARLGTLELKGWIRSRKGERKNGRKTPTVYTILRHPWLPGWPPAHRDSENREKSPPKARDQLPRRAEGEGWYKGRERKRDLPKKPHPAPHPAYLPTGIVVLDSTIPGAANASPTPCISPLSKKQLKSVVAPGGPEIEPVRTLPHGADVVEVKCVEARRFAWFTDANGKQHVDRKKPAPPYKQWCIRYRAPSPQGRIQSYWAGWYPTRETAEQVVETSRKPISRGGEP